MTGAAVLSVSLLFGCGGQNKQKTEKEMDADTTRTVCTQVKLQKDSLLATLTLDGMKVTWIHIQDAIENQSSEEPPQDNVAPINPSVFKSEIFHMV